MLHLLKLAVGVRDVAHLRTLQAARATADPPLRHQTRTQPRRAAEIVDGGSIYWVIQGALCARQRVLAIIADRWDDGTACAGLVLDTEVVAVAARRIKPFQGWRYLQPTDAPADLTSGRDTAVADMPPSMAEALRTLCLL